MDVYGCFKPLTFRINNYNGTGCIYTCIIVQEKYRRGNIYYVVQKSDVSTRYLVYIVNNVQYSSIASEDPWKPPTDNSVRKVFENYMTNNMIEKNFFLKINDDSYREPLYYLSG
jgi:hypothetical protein